MSSINKVFILGNLGQDPELRYTPTGKAVCTLSVATSEERNDAGGNRTSEVEWHRVIVWDKAAENAAKYLSKGSKVHIEGRIKTRSWDDAQSGQKKYATEIIAAPFGVTFIDSKGGRPERAEADDSARQAPLASRSFPQKEQEKPFSSPSGMFSGSLDDIPF